MAFRKTIFESVAQLQADLNRFVESYNRGRAHQGYRTQGRSPYQAFCEGMAARAARKETDTAA